MKLKERFSHFIQMHQMQFLHLKKLVRDLSVKINEDTIKFTIEALADVWENPEAIEGINAFFEKKKPSWIMEN